VDDTGIVAAMRQKDQAGLAAAYDAYANPLYTYCVSQLRDEDRAGDVLHDTFIVAYERIGQLRDPSRLKPWLYAIARNECQRVFRERNRSAPLDEAMAVSDQTVEMGAGLRQAELRGLVQTAAGGLNPREREVIELAVQHDMAIDDVAATLGQSPKYVHALLSKARQQMEKSLSALIVARTGRESCGTLDGLLAGWDGGMTVLLRKRVARHIESCPICAERKRRDVNAMALLATTPILAAPLLLRSQLLSDVTDLSLVSANRELAERAGPFDGDGFPAAINAANRSGGWMLPVAAALIGAAIVLGGLSFMLGGPLDNLLAGGGTPSPTTEAQPVTPSPAETTPPQTVTPAPTPEQSPPPAPPTTPTDEPEATPAPTRPTPTFVPVPVDALGIFCDRELTQPCDEVDLGRANRAVVFLASTTDDVLDVTASSAGELLIAPASTQVASRPVEVSVESVGACGENVVTFTVAEPSQSEELTVNAQPCIR
jgi:RNA polymerase sigma factor (sigma-70 family)